jgi:hypothetical protein
MRVCVKMWDVGSRPGSISVARGGWFWTYLSKSNSRASGALAKSRSRSRCGQKFGSIAAGRWTWL